MGSMVAPAIGAGSCGFLAAVLLAAAFIVPGVPLVVALLAAWLASIGAAFCAAVVVRRAVGTQSSN